MLVVAPREQTGNTPPTLDRIPYLERTVTGRNRFSIQTIWLEVRRCLHSHTVTAARRPLIEWAVRLGMVRCTMITEPSRQRYCCIVDLTVIGGNNDPALRWFMLRRCSRKGTSALPPPQLLSYDIREHRCSGPIISRYETIYFRKTRQSCRPGCRLASEARPAA
jgi:hypothetical protein